VLDAVVALFWEKGFEATSVADIVEATGLNKSSLYNAFGSKEALFALAVDRYLDIRGTMIADMLIEGSGGIDDLEMFIGFMEQEATSETGRQGCLAVNTSTELGLRDDDVAELANRFRSEIRTALRAVLDRAEAAGEIEARTAEAKTEILLAFMLSMAVIVRSGAGADEIAGQFAGVRALLVDWQAATRTGN